MIGLAPEGCSRPHFLQCQYTRPYSRPRSLTIPTSRGDIVVNYETGEVLSKPSLPVPVDDRYVGVDTVTPWEARTAKELQEALSVHDRWLDKCTVEHERLVELLSNGASGDAVCILSRLASGLAGRNVWFGKLADVYAAAGIPQRNGKRALQELDAAGLIEMQQQGTRHRLSKIAIHPWYGWCGSFGWREEYCKDWVAKRTADLSRQVWG